MSMLEDIKIILRVSSSAFDPEITMLINAARADMKRVGVNTEFVEKDDEPLVKQAIACYCKARFGFDNDDADLFERSYRQSVADMLNSSDYNTAGEYE